MKAKSVDYYGGTYRGTKTGKIDAQISVDGVQQRKRFSNVANAKAWLESMKRGEDAPILTPSQVKEAYQAFKILRERGNGKTLIDCLFAALGSPMVKVDLRLDKMVETFLEAQQGYIGDATRNDYRLHLGHFAEAFLNRGVHEISRSDVSGYAATLKDRPTYHNHFLAAVKRFWSWMLEQEYTLTNPTEKVKKLSLGDPAKRFLSVEQTIRLLNGIIVECPELVPYAVLGLFGGLRPAEAMRATAGNLNMQSKHIRITDEISKTNRTRNFEMPPNLHAWLTAFPVVDKVTGYDVYRIIKKFRKVDEDYKVGLSQDVLRHTFATFRTALTQDSAKVAFEMGHSESIANRHYRGLVDKPEAEAFFNILPKPEGSTFKAAVAQYVNAVPSFSIPMRPTFN